VEEDLRAFAFLFRLVFVHSCNLIYVPPSSTILPVIVSELSNQCVQFGFVSHHFPSFQTSGTAKGR
jgi:hypothetical protein